MNIYDASAHEKLNQEWELGCLTMAWIEELKVAHLYDAKNINKLYSRAIQLQAEKGWRFIMPSHMFYNWVSDGSFIDYDGHGYFLNWDGERQDYVRCNIDWLEDKIEQYPFVAWFNK